MAARAAAVLRLTHKINYNISKGVTKSENKFSDYEFCDFAVFDCDLLRKPLQNVEMKEVDFADAKSWS